MYIMSNGPGLIVVVDLGAIYAFKVHGTVSPHGIWFPYPWNSIILGINGEPEQSSEKNRLKSLHCRTNGQQTNLQSKFLFSLKNFEFKLMVKKCLEDRFYGINILYAEKNQGIMLITALTYTIFFISKRYFHTGRTE